jgi:Rrf2 family iron-sulfur cluster assembly transcriptional regulator
VILSRAGEYGVQIALHLAEQHRDGYVPVRELARQCGIPFYFLGKICHRLTRHGILVSYKGPNGGVALARPSREVTVLQVVEAMEGLEGFERCVLGLDLCDDAYPCPLHTPWRAIKERILHMLSTKNLADLARDMAAGKSMLNPSDQQVPALDPVGRSD